MPKGIFKRIIGINCGKDKFPQCGFQKGHKINLGKKYALGYRHTEKAKKKVSKFQKGRKHQPQCGFQKGHPDFTSKEGRKRMALKKQGENNPNWKNGISPINQKIRGSFEYKLWQNSVFDRDDYLCQRCKEKRISKLVAHHIKNFAQYPELRFVIENGITLCKDCHKLFHKIYGKKNNTQEQIKEFLIAYLNKNRR